MSSSNTSTSSTTSSASSGVSIGILFLTAGLVMRHVCDGIDDVVCERVYDDGQALIIAGSIIICLPLIILCVCIPCFMAAAAAAAKK